VENNNHKTQFNAALADPASVGADALAALITKYPYAQALRVAQARYAWRASQSLPDGQPLLYVGEPHRFKELIEEAEADADDDDILFVGSPDANDWAGENPTEAIGETDELPTAGSIRPPQAFQIDDPESAAADQLRKADGEFDAKAQPESVGSEQEAASPSGEVARPATPEVPFAIETVVPDSHNDERLAISEEERPEEVASRETAEESSVATSEDQPLETTPTLPTEETSGEDPRAEEALEVQAPAEEPVPSEQQIVRVSQARPHEKVSLYDDEHLPYTFLWWLKKARMDHAATYRPYAQEDDPSTVRLPAATEDTGEQALLDQQIRENIFHLQPPEEKLTVGNEAKTVSFKVPKKTDPIIERFIREEPQIKPPNPEKLTLQNMAKHSAEDVQEIVTETLAKIYADQGHYNKAIEAYKKLSLKYPEKSSYFAERISELEKKFA